MTMTKRRGWMGTLIVLALAGLTLSAGTAAAKPILMPTLQKAIKTLGPMALQGVSVGPDMRLAIINGVTFREGEPQAMEDGGPQICVKTIGLDYAIVHVGNRDTLLRLEQPKSEKDNDAAAAKPDAKTGTTGTNRPQGPSSAAKEEDPVEQLKHMVQQIQQLK